MKKDLGTICATLKSWSEKKVWLKILSILLVGETVAFNACTKSKVEEPIVPKENTVTDICGRTYPVVKIGEQYWMAENLACIEYDTQSEPYNAGLRKLSTSEDETIEPYYTNGMDQSKWKDPEYAINLTDKQIQKLGFLYNWQPQWDTSLQEKPNPKQKITSGRAKVYVLTDGICQIWKNGTC